MKVLSQAVFWRAAGGPADLPPPDAPEIALAGRSNVGKSSAINALAGRRALARTSKTPGRTQTINFYGLESGARLVDLPGYGYARVPQAMRDRWRELVASYLQSARGLAGVVLIMDARHPLTPLDEQLIAWLGGGRWVVLRSKADKLSKREQAATLGSVQQRLSRHRVTLFSSVTRQG